MKKATDLR